MEEKAKRAVEILLQQINGQVAEEMEIKLPVRLMKRKSVREQEKK